MGEGSMIKRKIFLAMLLMCTGILTACGGKMGEDASATTSGDSEEVTELFIFNSKGEIADTFQEVADAYEAESGVKVRVFNTNAGDNYMQALRTLMNEKVKPDIYTVQKVTELTEWVSYDYAMDFSSATNMTPEFKELTDGISEELRMTLGEGTSYGIPYNMEGYGYIVDTKMLEDIFGSANKDAVLEALRTCSYAEWEAFVRTLGDMIDTGTAGNVTLSGKQFAMHKSGLATKLTGVFAFAGTDAWTYGDHYLNVALCAGVNTVSEALNADKATIQNMKGAIKAFAKALDLKTTYAAGDTGHLTRSAGMVDSKANSYDAAIQKFSASKAVFFKNGNWVTSAIQAIDPEMAERLVFLPVKMPVTQADITAEGLTVEQMNSTIPVFVPMYYAVNARNDEAHQKAAQDFLVWLNTSETGRKYITEMFQFIPFNADPATTQVDNALGNSIIEYVNRGGTLSNPYNGAPSNWGGNTVGAYIQEKYLTKAEWNDAVYEDIANYAIDQWIAMGEVEQ